jgi:hypothetical protein
MLRHGATRIPKDLVMSEEEIKDPYVLEFLGLSLMQVRVEFRSGTARLRA